MININGELFNSEKAQISFHNRGFQYGDALFETIRVINSKIIFWESHYFRLMSSMRLLRMQIPMHFSPEFLEGEIIDLIKTNNLEKQPAKIKINISRKAGGLYYPENRNIDYFISCQPLDNPFFTIEEDFYEIELFKDHFINSGLLSTLKTNNKLVNILGSIYAKENGYNNCLLLNEKKSIVEFTNANVFLVNGTTIKTSPTSDGCLKGVIREKLIGIIEKTDKFNFKEENISPFELQKADEMFLTNAVIGIKPVSKYRKKEYENTVAKELLGKLNAQARLA
ncbi:aminotransferase class IV [Mesohalobacter halotolerans]|uniref:branched-chain-amino-acid transaminase n=1 Tax=Mesohalobacter halotolerans TaxID=1883405 RepID=A0A4U5TQR8_9FLAO|nr:aminotransferase class IV [Mesohalobacter halotolerans]MBS3738381.1 aminotransferase class IV [Psychroflexus sp.]TKS56081.1 aminotransferase class IV [Mesohalobacter halotolerans]